MHESKTRGKLELWFWGFLGFSVEKNGLYVKYPLSNFLAFFGNYLNILDVNLQHQKLKNGNICNSAQFSFKHSQI